LAILLVYTELAEVLRGADDVRTYWSTTKEWFEVPVLAGRY